MIRKLVEEAALILARPRSTPLVKRLMKIAVEGENKPLHRAEAEALVIANSCAVGVQITMKVVSAESSIVPPR